jgi:hypothetical protein
MVVLAVDVVVVGAVVVAASSALSLHAGNSNTTTVSGINQRRDNRRNIGVPPSAAATGWETAYVSSTTKRIPPTPGVQAQTDTAHFRQYVRPIRARICADMGGC